MITIVNQVSSVWFDNKLLRKSLLLNETNFNKCEFTEKFCEFINLITNSVQDSWLKSTKLCWIVEVFPWDWILWTMQEKMKFVFNYTRVTNRAESIVVGILIISSSFNIIMSLWLLIRIFTNSFPLVEFLVKSRLELIFYNHVIRELGTPVET